MGPAAVAALSLGLKGLSGLFKAKADKKRAGQQRLQQEENRRAQVAGLTLQNKQGEDRRRASLALANSLLGGVPATTAGGGVNTNVALDPAIVSQLDKERSYDFEGAVPRPVGDANAGATYGFLEGLFGGAADTAAYAFAPPKPTLTIEDLLKAMQPTPAPTPYRSPTYGPRG